MSPSVPAPASATSDLDTPAPSAVRVTAWLALAAQLGIVVTGALVRLTGSGLGCPTWPQCMPGSYTPVPHPASRYHASIEFGNRLLTFAVLATAVAALVAARPHARRNPGRRLLWFAAVPLIGTFAQAVVGGLSVLTGLSPWWVAAHFLLSAAIIAATQVYVVKVTGAGGAGTAAGAVALPLRWLVLGASAVLLLGTAVTGAGPHAGDADVTQRFPWHPLLATALHSSAAWALVVGVVVCVRRTASLAPRDLRRLTSRRLLTLLIAQAVVGYAQTLLDLPPLLVGAHVALAVLTWSGAVRLAALSAQERVDSDG
ncbi:MAG: COX15/CtaA family protein [Actinomycetales bacterium]|nr:COX15/CtaA family protein [Actinomycetales bacterium]